MRLSGQRGPGCLHLAGSLESPSAQRSLRTLLRGRVQAVQAGESPRLGAPCSSSEAGPLAGGHCRDPVTLFLSVQGQPTPDSSFSAWHSQSWTLSESMNAAHGWGRIWDQDSGSWTKALREGLGSDQEWEGEGLLSLHLSGSPSVSRWRRVPELVPTRRGLQGGGSHLVPPGLPPGCRPGVPADARLSCLLLCQEAGGEVLRVAAGHPSSTSRRDCVSTAASPSALHPGLFTPEATEPPGRAVPQVNIGAALPGPSLREPSGKDHPK